MCTFEYINTYVAWSPALDSENNPMLTLDPLKEPISPAEQNTRGHPLAEVPVLNSTDSAILTCE